MSTDEKVNAWIWAVMEKIGESENLYALEEEGPGSKMIPVFQSQEDALICSRGFAKQTEAQYEIEAMQLPLVAHAARTNGADIVILDADGRILERLTPTPDA